MKHVHLTRWIEVAGARQVVATGLVLIVFALPAPALAQRGLIGGLVGGMVNQGFQSSPQYYPPPPQQYYQSSIEQYYPPPSLQNNQQRLQQNNEQVSDQFIRDEKEAERLRRKRASAIVPKKAKIQNQPVAKAPNHPADATMASATPTSPSSTSQQDTAVQPGAKLPVFPDQTAYTDVRNRLLALGYTPSSSGTQPCDSTKDESCYPEREFCAGSNVIQCNFSWKQDNKVIRVQTVNWPPIIAKIECLSCQQYSSR